MSPFVCYSRSYILTLLIIIVMILGLVPACTPFAPTGSGVSHVQPLLLQMATDAPDTRVRVIVQQQTEDAQLDQQVIALGGEVNRKLNLINGFAAEIPVGMLPQLAQADGLRYISLDAPTVGVSTMHQAETGSGQAPSVFLPMLANGVIADENKVSAASHTNIDTVRDEFTVTSFGNNDGSINWVDSWIEHDTESGGSGPTDGQIQISNGQLRLDDMPDTGGEPSAARTVDLTGAISASFSFDYETTAGVDGEDAVTVEVSNDGGASYTILETFTGIVGATSGVRTYDISSFISPQTTIRFRVANLYGASDEFFKVDNVEIASTNSSSDAQPGSPASSPVPTDPVFTTWATEFGQVSPVSNPLAEDFENEPILRGSTLWFNSVVKADPPETLPVTLHFDDVKIHFTANHYDFSLDVPASTVIYDPAATVASTLFDAVQERWITTVPPEVYGEETFLTGLAWPLTFDLVTEVKDVTWTGRFSSNAPEEKFEWKWGAAAYSTFASNHGDLVIKPVKGEKANPFDNKDEGGTPQHHKPYLIKGGTGKGGDKYVGSYSSNKEAIFTAYTNPAAMIDSALGPDGIYAHAGKSVEAFAGFDAEITPGYTIGKVEVVLHGYATTSIDKDLKFTTYIDGVEQDEVKVKAEELFVDHVGAQNSGTVFVDITTAHEWRWSDFSNNLQLLIEHHDFKSDKNQVIYYDAIGLRVTGTPGTEPSSASPSALPMPRQAIDTSNILNAFPFAVRAPEVWNQAPSFLQGQRMTIAVVDSGIGKTEDLKDRNVKDVNFNKEYHDSKDMYGHGTFVATMIAGDGKKSSGAYIGIAPNSHLLNVRVSNDEGMAYESDVVAALQWILENKEEYNTRVVNLSLNSSIPMSYHDSPMSAAVEMLWFNGIVVVVAAGNNGTAEVYSPANDPYVITVGATDDMGTWNIADDVIPSFSAYGTTIDGYSKPDLVAPGTDIVMYLPRNDKLEVGRNYQSNQIDKNYFRMSGTSMSAPIVSAAAALLLQDEPHLTPDQVKYRLMSTANQNWAGYDPLRAGAGYLDIYAAVNGATTEAANQENMPHLLLARMAAIAAWANQNGGDSLEWDTVNWDAVNWDSVNWGSVNWGSVNWGSVNWGSVNWGSVNWGSVNWGSVNWGSVNWGSVNWGDVVGAADASANRLLPIFAPAESEQNSTENTQEESQAQPTEGLSSKLFFPLHLQ